MSLRLHALLCLLSLSSSLLQGIVRELHRSCSTGSNKDDANKGTYLLEIYAIEIAMYQETNQKAKLKEVYPKTQNLDDAIQDPRIMGGIYESGGKMYMEESRWQKASKTAQACRARAACACLSLCLLSKSAPLACEGRARAARARCAVALLRGCC